MEGAERELMADPRVAVVCLSDRPMALPLLLQALALQTMPDFECWVLDQSERPDFFEDGEPSDPRIWAAVGRMQDRRFRYKPVQRIGDWGQTVKAWAAGSLARSEWICFPNDDAYYVPGFFERMLDAADRQGLDLVYCDWIFDKFGYVHYEGKPVVGHIDVGGFLVKRSVLEAVGWQDKSSVGDGKLIEAIVEAGYRHGKASGVLYVKN